MATHSSALKRHRQNLQRRDRNRQLRGRLRSSLKAIRTALDSGDRSAIETQLASTLAVIDRMASKRVIHRNTAARYKSRLTRRASKPSAAA